MSGRMNVPVGGKLDVVVIVAAIVGLVVLVEHKNHISVEVAVRPHHTPADDPKRPALPVVAEAAMICPDRDDVPYSPACLAFLDDTQKDTLDGPLDTKD
jgi:hypothetical protein